MSYSNYPGGFKSGVTIRGVPIELTHPGRVFWVGNSAVRLENEKTAANGNDGSFLAPFSTIEGALNNSGVTASRGDVLFVRPGHTLTVSTATALNFDKAGIALIGLGVGSDRPTITLDTATTATIPVSVNNFAVRNVIFVGNFDNISALFTLTTADNFSVEDCLIRDTGAALGFVTLIDTSTVANDCDGLYFARNVYTGLDTDAGDVPFTVDASQADWTVIDNFIYTNAIPTAAGMFVCAANAGLVRAKITGNYYRHAGTDVTYGLVVGAVGGSTATGIIADNVFATRSTAASAAIVVAAAASGIYRVRNVVIPSAAGAAAAARATEPDIIRQAALVQA